jgi:hypothetical protein
LPCIKSEQTSPEGPACREEDVEGTVYEAFWIAVCQPGWTVDVEESVDAWLAHAGDAYALAELPPRPATWPEPLPYGNQVLVFAPRPGQPLTQALAVYLADDAIVHVQNGCLRADQFVDGLTVLWRAPS